MKLNPALKIKLFFKTYWKPLTLIFLFYCFALLAVLRANDYYVDDTGRAVIGYGWTSDFKRYGSTFLGVAPYSLALWLYKFDAPCMALALFFFCHSRLSWDYSWLKPKSKKIFSPCPPRASLNLCVYGLFFFFWQCFCRSKILC